LSVGDIRWQIAADCLETAQLSQWRAYRKPPSLFRVKPLRPHLSQNGGPNAHPKTNFATRATTWRIL